MTFIITKVLEEYGAGEEKIFPRVTITASHEFLLSGLHISLSLPFYFSALLSDFHRRDIKANIYLWIYQCFIL